MQILERHQAKEFLKNHRRHKPIVATNGCFDILHVGHISLLEYCHMLGGFVVVGVNSDESVRALKGKSRPINSLHDRMKMLTAIRYVDLVVPFYEPRATWFLNDIKPDVYVKGGDYTLETLDKDERKVLEAHGTKIKFFSTVDGKSTTNLIKAIAEAPKQ